jgi:uncharacterized protein (UPF0332 family)
MAGHEPSLGGAPCARPRGSCERATAGRRWPRCDRNARSHAGTWALFREEFVITGQFEADLARDAQRAQARREASDYAAESFQPSEAQGIVATAARFVTAVERLTS